jgi:hypothetical protein
MTLLHPYCDLAEVRDQLSDKDVKVADGMLERAINATSRAVNAYCGRRFWQDATATVRTYRPQDPAYVLVHDISTTTGLVVKTDDGTGSWATTWTLGQDFQLEPLDAQETDEPAAWWRLAAIGTKNFPIAGVRATLQVTAKFGWSEVPADVNTAAILRAVALFSRRNSPQGVAGFGDFGVVRIRRDSDVAALLDPYTRISKPDV